MGRIGIGTKVGRLTVEASTTQRKNGYTVWTCRCTCGRKILLDTRTLQRGTVQDCGCSTVVSPGQKDITGMRFGKLTALCPTGERGSRGSTVWLCRCDCGKKIQAELSQLTSGYRKSCGCLSRPPLKDLVGKKFGKLTVIAYEEKERGMHRWRCACDCGGETVVGQTLLLSGKTKSCGCIRNSVYKENLKLVEGTSVTRLKAIKNMQVIKSNTSGYNGVYYNKKRGLWSAQITFQGQTKYLGSYTQIKDAVKARQRGEEVYDDFLERFEEGVAEVAELRNIDIQMRGIKSMSIEGKKTVYFELLGLFSYGEEIEGEPDKTSIPGKMGNKAQAFLQYLLVNHVRNITSDELIEQFWTKSNSSDPANALKNMLFKTRNVLKNMFPNIENPLLTLQGCYAWNPDLEVKLDSEIFELACHNASKKSGKAGELEGLMEAIALYKGDFLLGNNSAWAVSMRRYYQTLYLDACETALPLLQEKERWTDVINICEQASCTGPGIDTFVVYRMQAMISLGHPEQALEVYEMFRTVLLEEFNIEPEEQVERIHMLAESMCKNSLDSQDILKLVGEKEYDGKAFFCTFAVFQSVVSLERRHLARSGDNSSLAVISLDKKTAPTTDARRLERILMENLRTGDPVARLDAGSYILMLSGTSDEDALQVIERIDKIFHRVYSHSRACINFRVSSLEPEIA